MSGLDFLVIGAQKSGTTTLWQLLRNHPQLELPAAKEAPFFADERLYALGMERYETSFFGPREPGVLRGSVSPQYMQDTGTLEVSGIASRIAQELPDVKLIAILRDPVERALSHHRMTVRRGYERRPVARALRDQLSPGALAAARRPVAEFAPRGSESRVYANCHYVAGGEYGRILSAYRPHFDPSRLLTVLTVELERDPDAVLARIFAFLDVDAAWRPVDMNVRRLVGGDRTRVSAEDLRALGALLAVALPSAPLDAFTLALEEWNTLSGPPEGGLPLDLERRLRRHFAPDAKLLREHWNRDVPWAADSGEGHEPGSAGAADPGLRPAPIRDGAGLGADPADADRVADAIGAALRGGEGYSLIRLDAPAALLLDESSWSARRGALAEAGARQRPAAAAAALRGAITDADAVAVMADLPLPPGGVALGQLLRDQDLQPQLTCPPNVGHQLLGVDPSSGGQLASPPLVDVLKGRRLAAVCPAALYDWVSRQAQVRSQRAAGDQERREEFDVRVVVSLDDVDEIDRAVMSLAIQHEAYDAVLVLGDLPATLACPRIARELEVVALDLGWPLARFLHPGYNQRSAELARARWELEEYLRCLSEPEPEPRHALEGRLVRGATGAIFYIERGRARLVEHAAILRLFDHEPSAVEPEAFDDLPRGAPLAVVHERLTGPFVLLDGLRRAVELGVTLVEMEDFALKPVPVAAPPLSWTPGP